jgi:hypothetical protein
MKLARVAVAVSGALMLTFIVAGLTFAAPNTVAQYADDPTSAPTQPVAIVTPTWPITHPVVYAISLYFKIPYTEVAALHASGIGFGVIARAYLMAEVSNGAVTPTLLLDLHQAGTGWGQIKKMYGVAPGGNGLGAIMSGRANHASNGPGENNGPAANGRAQDGSKLPDNGSSIACPGNSCNAPGHNKPNKGPKK